MRTAWNKGLTKEDRDNSLKNLLTMCSICHKKEEVRIMRELKKQEVTK